MCAYMHTLDLLMKQLHKNILVQCDLGYSDIVYNDIPKRTLCNHSYSWNGRPTLELRNHLSNKRKEEVGMKISKRGMGVQYLHKNETAYDL